FMPVLRNMAHAHNRTLADRSMGNVFSIHKDISAFQRLQARQSVDQLRLTISVNSCYTDNFSFPYLEIHILNCVFFVLSANGHMLYVQHYIPWFGRFLLYFKAY